MFDMKIMDQLHIALIGMILKYIHGIHEYSTELIIIRFLLFHNSTAMCLEITRVIQHFPKSEVMHALFWQQWSISLGT